MTTSLSSEARFGIKRKQIYENRKLRKERGERKYERRLKKNHETLKQL